MHPMPRNVARVAAIAAVVVSGGAVVAVPPAVADIGAAMRFVCTGETSAHEVEVRVRSSAPASGVVGAPLQLGTVKVDVGIPSELADEVMEDSPGGASAPPMTGIQSSAEIAGVAQIKVAVDDAGRAREGGWPAFALAAAPSREGGTVNLTGSGVAPPVLPRSPGSLSWVAAGLDLSLLPAGSAAGAETAELSLHCAADKKTPLGTVRVQDEGRATAPGTPGGISRQAAAAQDPECRELPVPGVDPKYDFNDDPALNKIYDNPTSPDGLVKTAKESASMCITAAGFFNVKKAGNAVPISAQSLLRRQVESYGPANAFTGPNFFDDRGYFVNKTKPIPGTVLGFGFMPTRAVAEAVQVRAPGSGADAPITGNYRYVTLALPGGPANAIEDTGIQVAGYVQVKAEEAAVNGVPIDLGSKCMTSPTLLSASAFLGNQKTGIMDPQLGQQITAKNLEIPAFSGCGVQEDLSPLLTASVSGAGNYVDIQSGTWCMPTAPPAESGCVNGEAPGPRTLTIRPGGDVTAVAESSATGKPFALTSLFGGGVSCKSAAIRFHLDQEHWQAPFMLAKAGMSFEDCEVKGADGTVYPAAGAFTQEGDMYLNATQVASDGSVGFKLNNVAINAPVISNGQECTLRFAQSATGIIPAELPGQMDMTYRDGVLSAMNTGQPLAVSPDSTCNVFAMGFAGPVAPAGDFLLRPKQSITTP